ncbi:hypothetical protein Celgi_1544 [Cellulomonas gilvus ATCC 13127]|uniref:Uncharacterized protein n=1 Tax=Cellulomonas gilvus (strain ATCC 13127 / NRRL B-14078) TaxID=593907 RepID=F8A4F1_CELGA|nr:hypothetical protein Celgi_1544 [Cellulomonas gilvus ATCC 13127]
MQQTRVRSALRVATVRAVERGDGNPNEQLRFWVWLIGAWAGEPLVAVADPDFVDVSFASLFPSATSTGIEPDPETPGRQPAPVLLLPRWGRLDERRSVADAPETREAHEAQLLEALTQAVPAERVGWLGPAAFLRSDSSARVRSWIARDWTVDLVVETNSHFSGVHPAFQLAFIAFRKRDEREPKLARYVGFRAEEAGPELRAEVHGLLRRAGGQTEHGYVLRVQPDASAGWGFDQNHPRHARSARDLESFGQATALGEVAELVLPRYRRGKGNCPNEECRVIEARGIGRDGSIDLDRCSTVKADPLADYSLRVGDVLVVELRRPADRLRVAVVRPEHLPASAGPNLIVVRPNADIDEHTRQFLVEYLRSRRAADLLDGLGGAGLHVNVARLGQLPVPIWDADLREAFAVADGARIQFSRWVDGSTALLREMFELPSASEAREHLMANGRILRQRLAAAEQIETLAFIVRTQYPHPVAYRWRAVEAEVSVGDPDRSIGAIRECFEVVECVIASFVLASAHSRGIELGAVAQLKRSFNSGVSGPSLGDWMQLVDESSSRAFRSLDDPLLHAILRYARDAATERRALKQLRDDWAHLRREPYRQRVEMSESALESLSRVLKSADFLTDYKLVHIVDTRWDSFSGVGRVVHRVLAGDHSVVPQSSITSSQLGIEVDSLYALGPFGDLLLLRPFLSGGRCGSCQAWHTFHPDRLTTDHGVLRSLEEGHTAVDPGLKRSLAYVGLA